MPAFCFQAVGYGHARDALFGLRRRAWPDAVPCSCMMRATRFQPVFLGQLVLVMLELFLAAAFALRPRTRVVAVLQNSQVQS